MQRVIIFGNAGTLVRSDLAGLKGEVSGEWLRCDWFTRSSSRPSIDHDEPRGCGKPLRNICMRF